MSYHLSYACQSTLQSLNNGTSFPCNQTLQAVHLLERSEKSGMQLNLKLYSATLTALARNGRHAEAANFLERAVNDPAIKADAVLYTAAISACEEKGAWQQAVDTLKRAKAAGIAPDELMLSKVTRLICIHVHTSWHHTCAAAATTLNMSPCSSMRCCAYRSHTASHPHMCLH